jgi:ABC-type phosphate transport system ATPase subunit
VVAVSEIQSVKPAEKQQIKAEVAGLNFFYGRLQALKNINLAFPANQVGAIIGPSGCGKSTLLRCFNRIHDLYPETRYEGQIILQPSGINLIGPETDPLEMRLRMSMVFQKPNAFPKSVFENVAFGLRLRGVRVGRGKGPAQTIRLHLVRRSTATTLHRTRARDRSRDAFIRRTDLGTRSDCHVKDRGPDF